MEKGLKYLMKQYQNAMGIENINLENLEHDREFLKWLNERKIQGRYFYEILKQKDITRRQKNWVEINKSDDDTIALDSQIEIISPYISPSIRNYKTTLAHFRVYD